METTNRTGTTRLELRGNEFDNTINGNDGASRFAGRRGDSGAYDGFDVMTCRGGPDALVRHSTAKTGGRAARRS